MMNMKIIKRCIAVGTAAVCVLAAAAAGHTAAETKDHEVIGWQDWAGKGEGITGQSPHMGCVLKIDLKAEENGIYEHYE